MCPKDVIPTDGIVGFDFIKSYNVQMNYEQNTISFGNKIEKDKNILKTWKLVDNNE